MINKLGVIIKARDLADYIFLIIDKSPKKFRMTLASRLQNLSLDIIEQLVRANNVRLSENETDHIRRRDYQEQAQASLDILCSVSEIARNQQCIQPRHYYQICRMAAETSGMLSSWMKSDHERITNMKKWQK